MLTVLDHKDLPNPFKHAFLQGHTVSQRPPWILCPIGINVFFQKRNDLVTWEYINNTLLALHKFQAKVKYTYIRDTSETGLRYKNQSYKRQTESKIATKTDITQNTSATNWRGSDQNLSGTSVPLTGYSATDGRSKNDFFFQFFFSKQFLGLPKWQSDKQQIVFRKLFRDFCPVIWAFCQIFSRECSGTSVPLSGHFAFFFPGHISGTSVPLSGHSAFFFLREPFRDFCPVISAFCRFFFQETFQGLLSRYLGILQIFF